MKDSLYKVFAGKFYMLDENGAPKDLLQRQPRQIRLKNEA